jgi:hypothetical protein
VFEKIWIEEKIPRQWEEGYVPFIKKTALCVKIIVGYYY